MILRSWFDGWRRVAGAPAVVIGVLAMTIILAAPLAITMGGMIEAQLGKSLEADAAADGVNWDWWQEFTSTTTGLGKTFVPQIIGFAATLKNVSDLLDRTAIVLPVAGALALYLLAWQFLWGGVIDRYARQRPIRAHGFFSASGVFLFRFLRLGLLAGLVYWVLFGYVHPLLFKRWFVQATASLGAERAVFAWRLLMYGTFALLLAMTTVIFDYARIRMVVEDRRSAIGALLASLRFVAHRPGRVSGLYLLNVVTFTLALAAWGALAPGAPRAGASAWITFLVMQVWIVARLALRLQFLASETSLFQASLAHAAYTAAPLPAWPESPAAEAIR